jgi:hypothetical protein
LDDAMSVLSGWFSNPNATMVPVPPFIDIAAARDWVGDLQEARITACPNNSSPSTTCDLATRSEP